MNKFLIHTMIYMMSVISYIYLNNINISPLSMCSIFIKFICCNRSLKDSDVVSQPESLTVPFEELKKVGDSIESVVEDVIAPENKVMKKMVSWFDDRNTSKEKIT